MKRAVFLTSFLVVNILLANAQDSLVVKGVVLSDINQPLSNASISIEGSVQQPVVTNDSGEFTIMSASAYVWILVAPASGFKAKRIFLNNRKELKIYVSPDDISSGDDRISILAQQVTRRNMVAAYSDLKVANADHSSALTIDQYMQGNIPGAFVVNRSGMPGSGAVATIRGVRSMHASNQPLYIVDGVPMIPQGLFGSNLTGYEYNPLIGINLFDISQTTVIKDPAITAAYGTKGSNGVVLIETLDPRVTQTTIDLDVRSGLSLSPSKLIPQLDAGQHKTLMSEELFSSGLIEENIKEYYPTLFLQKGDEGYINYQHNTNWQDLIFRNSSFNNINLNVKGGDQIARYGLSFGYTNDQSIIKTTGFQGYNLRFVSRVNIFKWLRMNAGVSLNYNAATLKEAATSAEASPILASLAKSPLLGPYQYDLNGNEISALAEVDNIGVSNPLAIIQNYQATNHNYNFVATADLEGEIRKNLSMRTKFTYTYNVLKENIFMPNHGMVRYYDGEAWNVAKATNNDLKAFYNYTYLAYKKSLGTDQYITSNTGLKIQTNKFQLDWGLAKNSDPSDKYRALSDGDWNLRQIGGQNKNWNDLTAYENLFYSYKDKYLLSASASMDFSSRVGKNAPNTLKIAGNPFGLFYSGSIAWRLSNESFLKDLSWLEDLKIRVSAGTTGNDDIGESSAKNYYQAVKFREAVGLYPAVLPNDQLTFETVSQINAGIDLSLWGNRVTTNFDVFRSNTSNMLIYSPVDAYVGYDLRVENSGKLKNQGWELNSFVRLVDKNSFKWDITGNVSSVKNEVTAIKGDKLITSITGGEIVNMVGSPVNSFYGYKFLGVYSTQAEADAANLVNDKGMHYQAGDAKFEDISGPNGAPDGIIDSYDKTAIGNALPKYFGGLGNTFTYKRWSLSAFVQVVYGNDLYNYVRYKNEAMTGLENQSQSVLNRWQYDGQVTNVPRALANDPIGNSSFSTRWIENGSYIRLKNITLSYKIPEKFLVFRNAEFYVFVNNIMTLTKYLGYDPEFSYSFSQITQGIDYGQTPQARQFIAGIKIGL